jgi:gluconolactonase
MELLADGFEWSEGPVWIRKNQELLFSDVPVNKVYRWTEKGGLSVALNPSGYSGQALHFREPGSNGLTSDRGERLILCQHGNRQIARLESDGRFTPLAEHYQGRRFNSPNDLCLSSNGNIYFTDPPYGLEGLNKSPLKELMFNGVYLRRPSGEVVLVSRKLEFPNGIALSPDEKTLYVNQSDSKAATITAFPVLPDGTVGEGRVFFDATPRVAGNKGLPDGLKVDRLGNLFATGPGGVLVLSPDGTHLGTLLTGQATANCGFGDDGPTLYITADSHLCRVRLSTEGPIPGR